MFIVWVGGVDDYFMDEAAAKAAIEEWQSEGYDDVVMETA